MLSIRADLLGLLAIRTSNPNALGLSVTLFPMAPALQKVNMVQQLVKDFQATQTQILPTCASWEGYLASLILI